MLEDTLREYKREFKTFTLAELNKKHSKKEVNRFVYLGLIERIAYDSKLYKSCVA